MPRPASSPKSEVSVAVTRIRERHGFTMETFAVRMKVALNTVSRWENSLPPRGKALEKLYRFAKRNGHAASEATLLAAITREKSAEFRRYRMAQVLDPGNVHDMRVLLREWWQWEERNGNVDPFHDPERREYFLQLADFLSEGGRKEFLGEESE